MFMRNLTEKKLPILRKRAANLEPVSSRLRQAEEELSPFFAQSLDLLCVAGLDGYLKRLTPAWKTTLGWTLAELQGRPFLDFVHPDDRAATVAEVGKVVEGAATMSFENRYRGKDGVYKWLQWNARLLPGNRTVGGERDCRERGLMIGSTPTGRTKRHRQELVRRTGQPRQWPCVC
jgi:PAS domain S-box-containing protein